MLRITLLTLAVCCTALAFGDEPGDKKSAELDWAKDIAVHFLKCAKEKEFVMAYQLLTPELRKNVEPIEDTGRFSNNIGRYWQMNGDWTIASALLAPDRDEAVFKGIVAAKDDKNQPTETAFTIRVAKQKEPSRWRVDYFLFEEPRLKAGK